MNETEYHLQKLWPDFHRILEWDISSPEGLSAIVVAFLLLLAGLFAFFAIINYFRSRMHLSFYRKLITGTPVEQLLEKRRDIVNSAFEKKESYGKLWREFDESLVIIPAKERLCNTLDASHFFNTHSLARRLTENRLLAAVPGFLTAIGVLGTFAGLEMGLAGLEVTSEDVSVLKEGISSLIGGASIAFMTSVWGVLTSVLFNFFEKVLERSIRSSITQFQNEVDYLYPRITAEQSLSNIEEFSRQSYEKLAELDEKIGHKMQEAMREASVAISQSVTDSLNSILGPAIDRLVNDAQSGSEKALEGLLERFLTGVGNAGETQKEMMKQAAQDMSTASGSMAKGLNHFTSQFDSQLETFIQKQGDSVLALEIQLSERQEIQAQQDEIRQQQMTKQVQAIQGSQVELTGSVEKLIGHQSKQYEDIQLGLSEVLSGFRELTGTQREAASIMRQSSANMDSVSNQLGLLSVNLKQAAEDMGIRLQRAVELSANVSEQHQSTLKGFEDLLSEMNDFRSLMHATTDTLKQAAEMADKGLSTVGRHFDTLGDTLNNHVEKLQQQISELLIDYTNRVQTQTTVRLNEWNEQTNEYISQMTDAVGALSNVVDEIETKLGK